jgi:hypothetical protein
VIAATKSARSSRLQEMVERFQGLDNLPIVDDGVQFGSATSCVSPAVARSYSVADTTLAADEERVLRCLGGALIMQWNTLPTKLQRELFDNAGAMGELLNTTILRGQIARFLHKHKDSEFGNPSPNVTRAAEMDS